MLIKIISFSVLMLAMVANATAQDLKIAYVDIDKAVNSSALAKKLSAQLEQEFSTRIKNIKSQESALRNERQQAVKDGLTMSAAKKEEVQTSLLKKERKLRFEKSIFDEDVKLANNKLTRQVEQAVLKVVSDITKQENYDLVLTNGVLFSSKRINITDQVIAKLQ